jgi:DNA-binding IclR family transcriptional regulator
VQRDDDHDDVDHDVDARRAPVFRVLDLLRFITVSTQPVTVAEIAAELSLPRGTVHRLCVRLEREGWLEREPDGRHFTIGAQAETVAERAQIHSSRRATRHAILEALSARVGATCNFTTLSGRDVLYLDRVETSWPASMQLQRGSLVPTYCTASGKLLLATIDDARRTRLIETLDMQRLTERTVTDRAHLKTILGSVAACGYALDDEEFMPGLIALAVPVVGPRGRVLGAVALHAPRDQMSLEEAIELRPLLQAAARDLVRTMRA